MDWDMYFVELGGMPATVRIDLQADTPENTAHRRFLVRGTIQLRETTDHGLASRRENAELNDLEDRLEGAARAVDALFVGRVTRDGRSIFCFYAPAEAKCRNALATAASQAGTYELTVESETDEDWAFYREFLFPAPIQWQEIMNRRIVDNLRAHGDPITVPRRVDHWATFPSSQQRAAFVAACADLGLSLEDLTPGTPFGVQLVHQIVPQEDKLHELTGTLIDLAESYGGEYAGLETEVITNSPA